MQVCRHIDLAGGTGLNIPQRAGGDQLSSPCSGIAITASWAHSGSSQLGVQHEGLWRVRQHLEKV